MTLAATPPRTKAEAEDAFGAGEVQQCPRCDGWHSKHSPPLCHACAMGMEQPAHPDGPDALNPEAS